MISIHPKWCELIANGKKTVEVRKTRPKIETPFKCYIYQTRKPVEVTFSGTGRHISEYDRTYWYNERSGKVIGEFVCDTVEGFHYGVQEPVGANSIFDCYIGYPVDLYDKDDTCLTRQEIDDYGNKAFLYGWHISDLLIYDQPRELREFYIADLQAVRQCSSRRQAYYSFTDTGYIKNGFYCEEKDDFCFGGCKRKVLTRPPQSWCYVDPII